MVRGGFGLFYGPGQFEDRIQPIENYIDRSRVQASDVPANTLQYPVDPATSCTNLLSIRGYTHDYPNEYNMQYGASVSHELPGAINLTVGYTGSQGYDMFLRGVGNVARPGHARRARCRGTARSTSRPAGCVDDLALAGIYPTGRLRPRQLRRPADQRHAPLPRRLHRRAPVSRYSRNKGTTQGSNEAATAQNTFDFETEYGTNPQDIPHTFNGSLVYLVPGEGFWSGGWRVGGIVNARSGVPLNVTIARPDNVTVNGVNVANIPGGNSRGTQRPDLVPGVDPYINDGRRPLAEPGGVHDAAAGHLRQPAPQLPARAVVRAVRPDVQQGLPVCLARRACSSASRCSTCSTG